MTEVSMNELVTRAEQPATLRALEQEEYDKTRTFSRGRQQEPAVTMRELRLSPHLSASLAHAFRDSQQVKNGRFWRTAFFVQLVFAVLPLTFGLVQLGLRASVQPFVIEKDQHGYVVVIGPAKAAKMDDPLVVIASLHDWIIAARSVLRDVPATKGHVRKVWEMVSPGTLAHQKVSEWFTDERIFGNPRRSIDVGEIHVEPIAESERVWKIQWTETLYEEAHGLPARSRHSALVTIAFAPSNLLARIMMNPKGVFITDISITNY